MSPSEMTLDDRMGLEQFRNERFRSFFAQNLLHCTFHRDRHKALIIHCPKAWIVDSLLTELEELCDYAWLSLGVEAIALYFAQEEVCRVEQYRVQRASSGLRYGICKRSE